ncbi:type IV secretion system protein [Comamonas testosteroni]|uniref:type IV secretion system protein n=1 Tax=Comamonas testosteroni TaxID=285 RepID=UPI0005B33CB4|nr:type IV secretion system protein [Comamonas testosteroni]
MKLLLSFIISVILLVHPQVYAQESAVGNGSAQADSPLVIDQSDYKVDTIGQTIMRQIVERVSNGLEQLKNNTTINGAGEQIITMLMMIMLAWGLIKAMFGNGFNQFIEEVIHIFMLWGIVQAVLHAGGIEGIQSLIDSIASSFANSDMSTLSGAMNGSVENTFSALSSILSMPSSDTKLSLTKLKEMLPLVAIFIVQLLGKITAGFIVVIAFVVYAANVILSFCSVILATAFAPIMVPFLLNQHTSFLFNSWIRFFIGALLMKCVGAFFMSFTNTLMRTMNDVAASVVTDSKVDPYELIIANFVVYVSIVGLAGLAAYLMTMVPKIATGLISGSGGNGFSGMRTITQSPAMQKANQYTTVGGNKGK